MDAIIGCHRFTHAFVKVYDNLPGHVLARAISGQHEPLSIHACAHIRHRRSTRECWSADQHFLLSISVVEEARESYIPPGIDVGIDVEGFAAQRRRQDSPGKRTALTWLSLESTGPALWPG